MDSVAGWSKNSALRKDNSYPFEVQNLKKSQPRHVLVTLTSRCSGFASSLLKDKTSPRWRIKATRRFLFPRRGLLCSLRRRRSAAGRCVNSDQSSIRIRKRKRSTVKPISGSRARRENNKKVERDVRTVTASDTTRYTPRRAPAGVATLLCV